MTLLIHIAPENDEPLYCGRDDHGILTDKESWITLAELRDVLKEPYPKNWCQGCTDHPAVLLGILAGAEL